MTSTDRRPTRAAALLAGALLAGALLTLACTPGSTLLDAGVRNQCDTTVQVQASSAPDQAGNIRVDVPPGETLYVATGDYVNDDYYRLGLPLDDPDARFDVATPFIIIEPDDYITATPEEQADGDYEGYFVIEGDLCP